MPSTSVCEKQTQKSAKFGIALTWSYMKQKGPLLPAARRSGLSIKFTYVFFMGHHHEPNSMCCWETESVWEMTELTNLFVAYPGNEDESMGMENPEESKCKQWDAVTPGAFPLEYAKGADATYGGILMKRNHMFADSGRERGS
jgi:hypothetical protein